ncbi:hypothetical protein BCM40_03565 [Planococcus donghaensis]|uniref:Glycosyl transferase family 1 n=2 Tax=Planococcus donghaensis TaxID=414778 RepID=A0A1C7EMD9_9BACL|nr:hypothetical protein BCM40_03565 [Planococcus donghaensis]
MNAAGLETLIMNLYRHIDKDKVQFDFAVQTTEKSFYDNEIIKMGGRIISHPKPNKGIKDYKISLKNTLEKYGPYDVVHSHVLFFSGTVLDIAKKNNVPIRIAHSHNTNDSRNNALPRKIYKLIMRKKIKRNATHLIGCSKQACEYVFGKTSYQHGKSSLFPNAIDLAKFKEIKRNTRYLLEELNLPKDSILIGHVGRFTKQKNHSFIIDIFSNYSKEESRAHLVLVGEGEEIESIKEMVLEKNLSDKVHFLGLRNDIPQFMTAIDLFIFPSLYEGLGIVLVEAQAAGVPSLISKNVPIEADLNIGLLNRLDLDSDSKSKWIAKIKELIGKEEIDWFLRENALKKYKYDIDVSVENLLKIYEDKT